MAGECWDEIPARSLGQGPNGMQQMKGIVETRRHRCFLSGRAVKTAINFLKVVVLASKCEELCTMRFCVHPGAGNRERLPADPAEDGHLGVICIYMTTHPQKPGVPPGMFCKLGARRLPGLILCKEKESFLVATKAQCDAVTTLLTCRSSCFVTINPSRVGLHPF